MFRISNSWRAAASRLADRWIAEIVIPFDTLRPLGRNEDCWHINFARNEHPHQETSSWSAVPNWFRTYARITSIDFVSAGTEASPFLLAVTVEN